MPFMLFMMGPWVMFMALCPLCDTRVAKERSARPGEDEP